MIGETRARFSRYFSFAGRNRFAEAIATCTRPASPRSSTRARMVVSFAARRSLRTLPRRALRRRAFAIRRHPAVSFAQNVHHPGNLRNPYQRRRPPNFARQLNRCVRAAATAAIAQQELHLFHQVVVRQTEQLRDTRILQRSQGHPAALHNRSQPPRDACAKLAVRVEEQPASRVPPLSVRVFSHQRNHFSSCLLQPAFLPSMVTTLPRNLRTPFSAPAGMRITSSNNPVIAVRNSSMSVKRSLV